MDADRELEMLVQALGLAEAARRWEGEGPASQPTPRGVAADVDGLPLFRRHVRETPEAPEPPAPASPPSSSPRPVRLRRWAVAAAGAVLILGSVSVAIGVATSGDAAPRVPVEPDGASYPLPPEFGVSRATLPLVSPGTWEPVALPRAEGRRLRRTMSDVDLHLMEEKLRRAIRRDGLELPEPVPSPPGRQEPRERGEGPGSGTVRFAKVTS